MKSTNVSLDDHDLFYAANKSASDFVYSQDCSGSRYQEIYCNPDCVLLDEIHQEVYWFDLGYTTVSLDKDNDHREHSYSGHNFKRKFSFAFTDNQYSVIDFTPLHTHVVRSTGFRPQNNSEVSYEIGQQYVQAIQIDENGTVVESPDWTIDKVWKSKRKMKIALTIGNMIVIFPVRIAYRHGEVVSFSSKDVVIPSSDDIKFSWNTSALGNICVAIDGSTSFYRQNRSSNMLRIIFPLFFPHFSRKLAALIESNSKSNVKRSLGPWLRKTEPFIRKYITPYTITHCYSSFSIFIEDRNN